MRVFLSHSQEDLPFADELRASLAKHGLDVWNPRLLYPGSNWLLESGKAFERADAVIFVVSRKRAHSPFLRQEVQFVIGKRELEGKVFVVTLQGGVKVPWILEMMHLIDATDRDAARVAGLILASIGSAKSKRSGKRKMPSARTTTKNLDSRSRVKATAAAKTALLPASSRQKA